MSEATDIVKRAEDYVSNDLGGIVAREIISGLLAEITRLRAAAESDRQRCAKIANEHSAWARSFGAEKACEMVAAAIRDLPPAVSP